MSYELYQELKNKKKQSSDPLTPTVRPEQSIPAPEPIRMPKQTVRDFNTSALDYPRAYGAGSGRMATSLGKGVEMFGKLLPGLDPEDSSPMKKAIVGTGQKIQEVGDTASKFWEDRLSDGAKNLKNAAWFEAPGMFNKLKAATLQAAESAPETVAIGLAGGPISGAAKGAGVARGLSGMLARTGLSKKAAQRGALWITEGMSYGIPEGVMAGLAEANQLSHEVDAMSHDQLMQSPLYQDYFKEDPATAKERLKESLELSTLLTTTALSTATGTIAGGGIFGDALNPATRGLRGFLERRVIGAGKEGFQEFWQSGFGEQLASNIVTKLQLNPDQKVMDNVLYEAAAGAGPGAVMGAVAGSGYGSQRQTLEERIKGVRSEARDENLAKIIEANLPTEDLEDLLKAPDVLYERGITTSDIQGLITNREHDEMAIANMDATVQSVLDHTPNAETKQGFLTSLLTKTLEKQTAEEIEDADVPEDFKSPTESEDITEPDTPEPVAEVETPVQAEESVQESAEPIAEEQDAEIPAGEDTAARDTGESTEAVDTADQTDEAERGGEEGTDTEAERDSLRAELKTLVDSMEALGPEGIPDIINTRALEVSRRLAEIDKQSLNESKPAVEEEKEEASISEQAPKEEEIRDELEPEETPIETVQRRTEEGKAEIQRQMDELRGETEPEVVEADEIKEPKKAEEPVAETETAEEEVPYTQDEVDFLNRKREMLKKDLFDQKKEGNQDRVDKIQKELDDVEQNFKDAAEAVNREKSHTPENVAYMERELTKLRGEMKLLQKQGKTQRAAKVQERIDVLQNNYEEANATLQRTAQATLQQIPLKEQEIQARTEERDEQLSLGNTERAERLTKYIEEQQQALDQAKTDRPRRALEELKTKETELQGQIDKAVKGKKKVSHLRREMKKLQEYITAIEKDVLATRKEKPTKSSSVTEVEGNIIKALGLKKVPEIIHVVQTVKDLPINVQKAIEDPNDDEAPPQAIYHSRRIYIISDNIDPGVSIREVLIHEGGHWLRRNDPIYEKRYEQLLDQFRELGRKSLNSKESKAVQEAYAEAAAEHNRLPDELIQEEALMYFLQEASNQDLPLYKKVVSLAKQFLFKHFNVAPIKLNMSGYDMAQIVSTDISKYMTEYTQKIEYINQEVDDTALSTKVKNSKPLDEFTKKQQEKLDRILSTEALQDEKVTQKQIAEANRMGIDLGKLSKDPEISKTLSDVEKTFKAVAFKRDESKQTTGLWYRIFSSPEYTFRKDPAAHEVLKHGIFADELKYRTQQEILGNFEIEAEHLRKEDAESYNQAGLYLRRVDKSGKGWRLKPTEDGKWQVVSPQGKTIATHNSRTNASEDLIAKEYDDNEGRLTDNARKFVRLFRELTNRSLEAQNADIQRQIDNAKRFGLREPTVPNSDTITLSEAIAASGDLQGTYFPRVRPNKEWVLRAEKEGADPITETFDFYYPENEISPVENWIRSKLSKQFPIHKRAKELLKQGYTITGVTPRNTPSEVVFDTAGILNSLDVLLGKAEETLTDEAEFEQLKALNDILTAEIANIYKAKGNLSTRLKRSERFSAGFEEDPIKAGVMHAQRISAGVAKRETARNMLLAATGRDISFDEWSQGKENPTQKGYRSFVRKRKIDATDQTAMYADIKTYMQHVLKPNQRFEKAIGYAKSLAVLWFLGFRVSSAAVNSTNMVLAVPATIAAHTRTSITKAYGAVADAAGKYTAYRSEQLTFRGAKKSVVDSALFYGRSALKGVGKAATTSVKLTDEEHRIFDSITARGWDEAHFNIDATRAVQDYGSQAYNTAISSSMYIFGAAEKANRAMTIFAAFKTLQKKNPKMGFEELLQRAKHASDRAHGVYGKATKPWLVQKYSFLDLPYTFMKFQHNYLLNMLEMGFNKETWKSGLMLLAAPAVLSGAGASVATPIIAEALKLLLGSDDPEEEFYAWAQEYLPDWADNVPRHGLLGIANVNFKGSLEMNMAFPTEIWELGGAPVGMAVKWYDAAQFGRFGEYQKAFEAALPVAAGNPIKAQRLYDEGLTTTSGYAPIFYGQDQLKATGYEAALMFAGFNPARLSGIREKIYHERLVVADYSKRRSEIARRMRKYISTPEDKRSQRQLKSIMEMWEEYNFDVSKTPAHYNIKFLTADKLNRTLEQSMRPSKVERLR